MNHLKTGNAYFGAGSYVKYKFGGKELQEFGAYDFGARIYMADIAIWFAVDPMAEQNPGLTPYRYGFNNPVMFTDPNGMLEQALTDKMWALGGTWYNTGDGFENESNIKLGYEGNYLSLNTAMDSPSGGGGGTFIQLPGMTLSGQHNQWGQAFQNAFNAMMKEWNAKSDFAWDRMANAGRYNDGPIQYFGGAGDPFGVWEVGGMALSSSDSRGMNLAAIPLLVMTRNSDDALKLLAAEKGILKAEAKAISKEAVSTNGTLTAGPFASEVYSAVNGHSINFTVAEKAAIKKQGYTLGCHTCGQTTPGTKSGNFILDHQPANALVPNGWPQTFYPQCNIVVLVRVE